MSEKEAENAHPEKNSSPEEDKEETPSACSITPTPIVRKPYVFTEKRKATLQKANQARLEKSTLKKNFKGQLEEMTRDLQTIYEKKVKEIINTGLGSIDTPPEAPAPPSSDPAPPPMSSSSSSDASKDSALRIEKVEQKSRPRKRASAPESESDSSDSEVSVIPKRTPKKRSAKNKHYISDSSEDDEPPSPPRRKSRKQSKKKYKKKRGKSRRATSDSESEFTESDSGDEYEPSRKPRRPSSHPPAYGHTSGSLYPGMQAAAPNYGGFNPQRRGIYSGCTF